MTQMLEFSDKDFKVAMIKMLQRCYINIIINTLEIHEK